MREAMSSNPAVAGEVAKEKAKEAKETSEFKCGICGMLFSSADDLVKHEKRHQDEGATQTTPTRQV